MQVYNPYLDSLPHRTVGQIYDVKVHDVGVDLATETDRSDRVTHRGLRLSERLASESEHETRVARRRARLLTATEDVFSVVQQMNSNQQGT